ncbi:MAG: sigma-70 family RNA polymerase sigma factor, partial [Acidobacteriota bacterium]
AVTIGSGAHLQRKPSSLLTPMLTPIMELSSTFPDEAVDTTMSMVAMSDREAAPVIAQATRDESAGILGNFDAVVRQHWPRVFRFALASLRDRDAAETLAQDCFYRAYRGRERFRAEASIQTWLMQIAVNLVRDHARNRRLQFWKRAPAQPVEDEAVRGWLPDGEISAERHLLLKERVNAVWRATTKLPERQRTVFLLRFVEEMELLQIVAATGLTEGAVKVHLYRALRSVRKRVGVNYGQ